MERCTTALAAGGFGSLGRKAGRGIESSGDIRVSMRDTPLENKGVTHCRGYPHLRGLCLDEVGVGMRVLLDVVYLSSLQRK